MSAIFTPTITRIYKITYFDLMRTKVTMGNMYMCLDTNILWYDSGTTEEDRNIVDYIDARTVNQLLNEITPTYGKNYYCWEDNSLWIWLNKWEVLYSDTTYPSAYKYTAIPTTESKQSIEPIYRYDMPNMPADDNGLLKDGSVVVRDRNRLIKGKISVSDDNDNLIISSFLGGGLRFLPNGKMSSDGEFYIDSVLNETTNQQEMKASLRAQLTILNGEMFVDYAEHPEKDDNKYPNSKHRYKIFHEGNLDISGIEVMTPLQVYNLLLDTEELPNEFDFNVARLGGHTSSFFATKVHTHNAQDVTGLYDLVQQQAGVATRSIYNNMQGIGITGQYDTVHDVLELAANNFQISLTGGVVGRGNVNGLSNTTIETTVDPTKHNHINYEQTMTSLQNQINALVIDPSFTYTKAEIDAKVDAVRPTTTPTPNKALVLDSNSVLPTTSLSTKKLDHNLAVNLIGDVVGNVTTTLEGAQLNINTTLNVAGGTIETAINNILAARCYKATIGDGVNTSYVLVHSLNSKDLIIQVRDTTTGQEVQLDTQFLDTNTIQLTSTSGAVGIDNLRVLIFKI